VSCELPAKSSVIVVARSTVLERVPTGPGPRREWTVPLQVTRTVQAPSTQFDAVDAALRDEDAGGGATAVVAVRAGRPAPRAGVVRAGRPAPGAGVVWVGSEAFSGLPAPHPSITAAATTPRALAAGADRRAREAAVGVSAAGRPDRVAQRRVRRRRGERATAVIRRS
jgi:hypothetical protein